MKLTILNPDCEHGYGVSVSKIFFFARSPPSHTTLTRIHFWQLAFFLIFGMLSDIVRGVSWSILSDIVSGSLTGILSDIFSSNIICGVSSDMFIGILSGVYFHMFLTFYLAFIVVFSLAFLLASSQLAPVRRLPAGI